MVATMGQQLRGGPNCATGSRLSKRQHVDISSEIYYNLLPSTRVNTSTTFIKPLEYV